MSDLLNGADVPWDAVSGPVERFQVGARGPGRPTGRVTVRFRVSAEQITAAAERVGQSIAETAADTVAACADGDLPGRDSLRARMTVAMAAGLGRAADRVGRA